MIARAPAAGWFAISRTILQHLPALTGAELKLLIYLASLADRQGNCWAGHATISKSTGLGKSSIRRATAQLVYRGLLKFTPGASLPGQPRTASQFTVLITAPIGRATGTTNEHSQGHESRISSLPTGAAGEHGQDAGKSRTGAIHDTSHDPLTGAADDTSVQNDCSQNRRATGTTSGALPTIKTNKGASASADASSPNVSKQASSQEEAPTESYFRLSADPPPKRANRERRLSSATSAPGFDRFWLAYPRKAKEDAARNEWPNALKRLRKTNPELTLEAAIELFVDAACAYGKIRRDESAKYTAHAVNWLKDGRWKEKAEWEELEKKETGNNGKSKSLPTGPGQRHEEDHARF